jgi:hypothetical protein
MPDKEFAIIDQYGKLMGEVRARLQVIDDCLVGKYDLPPVTTRELCYLQLRMICELIALASITAHGHLAGSSTRNSWSAEEIINDMAKGHQRFFPEPVHKTRAPPPVTFKFTKRKKDDFLTKKQLLALVAQCGGVLHRGSMRNWLKRKPIRGWAKEILSTRHRVMNLLAMHRITILKPGRYYFCEFVPDGSVETYVVGPDETELPAK